MQFMRRSRIVGSWQPSGEELEYFLSYNYIGEFDASLHKQCPYRSKHSIFRACLELKTSNKIVVNDAVRRFSPRPSHHCREGSSQRCCVVMILVKNATRHLSSEEQEVCGSVAMNTKLKDSLCIIVLKYVQIISAKTGPKFS